MADKERIQRVFDDGKSVGAAMQQAVRKEIEKKAKLGQHVVVWRDNRVLVIPADELVREKSWIESNAE